MTMIRPQGELRQREQPYRDEKYRRYVAKQPCMACGHHESQAAHISAGNYARGMKAPDYYCIPLCPPHLAPLGTMITKGCHAKFDENQERFAQETLNLSIDALKAKAKARWIAWESQQS